MAQDDIFVILDPSVVNSPVGPHILSSLSAPEDVSSLQQKKKTFHYRVQPLSVHSSITWIVKNSKTKKWSSSSERLILLKGSELGQLLARNSLHPWLHSLECSRFRITLLIYQYDTHFKQAERATQRKKVALVRGETASTSSNGSTISHTQAQKLLLEAQLSHPFNYMTFNADLESLGSLVYHHTRAIQESEDKEKKRISLEFGFYAPSAKGNASVNAQGVGCLNLWHSSLMQISQFIGIDRAKAIAEAYPSPTALTTALSSAENPEKLLMDIQVRRGADLLSGGSVKIGPEMSRKVAKMFLSCDGNELLQKGNMRRRVVVMSQQQVANYSVSPPGKPIK